MHILCKDIGLFASSLLALSCCFAFCYSKLLAVFCSADPPTIKKTQNSETPVGRMGTLQCEATAVPKPEFEWYRDEKR